MTDPALLTSPKMCDLCYLPAHPHLNCDAAMKLLMDIGKEARPDDRVPYWIICPPEDYQYWKQRAQ